MTVGLLIITHDNVGQAMVETATAMLEMCPIALEQLSVSGVCQPEDVARNASEAIERLEQGGGVLVLTDMYGSTPSNVANQLLNNGAVVVVAGLNLPMLVRVLNYPRLTLQEMARKAVSGGRDGIFVCEPE